MVKQKQGVWINYRWWLFRAWGRVGTTIGGNKVDRYGSVDTLLEGFKQLYAEKTGNEWHDRKNFKKYPNKFYPLDIDYGQVSLRKGNTSTSSFVKSSTVTWKNYVYIFYLKKFNSFFFVVSLQIVLL